MSSSEINQVLANSLSPGKYLLLLALPLGAREPLACSPPSPVARASSYTLLHGSYNLGHRPSGSELKHKDTENDETNSYLLSTLLMMLHE